MVAGDFAQVLFGKLLDIYDCRDFGTGDEHAPRFYLVEEVGDEVIFLLAGELVFCGAVDVNEKFFEKILSFPSGVKVEGLGRREGYLPATYMCQDLLV